MIKAVIFDLGGVLIEDVLYQLSGEIALKEKLNQDTLFEVIHGRYWRLFRTNKLSEEKFFGNAKKDLKLKTSIKSLKAMARKYTKINQKVLKIIKKLKRNYPLYAFNNEAKPWNEFKKNKYKLNKLFVKLVSSCDERLDKPNPLFYKRLMKRIKQNPRNCIFIDDKAENLKPARKLGMQTILFKSVEQLIKDLNKAGIKNITV